MIYAESLSKLEEVGIQLKGAANLITCGQCSKILETPCWRNNCLELSCPECYQTFRFALGKDE